MRRDFTCARECQRVTVNLGVRGAISAMWSGATDAMAALAQQVDARLLIFLLFSKLHIRGLGSGLEHCLPMRHDAVRRWSHRALSKHSHSQLITPGPGPTH